MTVVRSGAGPRLRGSACSSKRADHLKAANARRIFDFFYSNVRGFVLPRPFQASWGLVWGSEWCRGWEREE